jgi:hypothetical protein
VLAIVRQMLTKPTAAALTALAQLVETPRWRDVDAMFETEIEAVTLRLIGARIDADAHELRGRLATLRELRQTMRDARSTLTQQGRNVPLT